MSIYEVIKKYEGRVQFRQLAETVERAKVAARNEVSLNRPPEWRDETPEYDYKDSPKKLVLENTNDDIELTINRRGVLNATEESDE